MGSLENEKGSDAEDEYDGHFGSSLVTQHSGFGVLRWSQRPPLLSMWLLLLTVFGLALVNVTCRDLIPSAVQRREMYQLSRHCAAGTFGYKCEFECRCQGRQSCNKLTGECRSGCLPGYWGIGCQLENNCFYNGHDSGYMGTLSYTQGLYTCQRWDTKVPQYHTYDPSRFPDLRLPENYCRSTNDSDRPWCYVIDMNQRWQFCAVTDCKCPANRFGPNCRRECHCRGGSEDCNSSNGRCKSGCANGWTGINCQKAMECDPNKYGWHCEKTCQCENPRDCRRFLGPNSACRCRRGFFNPPSCEPVTPPNIVELRNTPGNPLQPSDIICVVTALPAADADEVRLSIPAGKNIIEEVSSLRAGHVLNKTFKVDSVDIGETYTCEVNGVAGVTQRAIVATMYELPRLSRPPWVKAKNDTTILLLWYEWSRDDQDSGEGEVIMYSVYYRGANARHFILAGNPFYVSCKPLCNFTLRDLMPNTRYQIYVTAHREGVGGEGPPGQMIVVDTECGYPSYPPKIVDQTVGQSADGSEFNLTVRWTDPEKKFLGCDQIKKYILKVRANRLWSRQSSTSAMPPVEVAGTVSSREYTIASLQPYTEYCAAMLLENDQGFRSAASSESCVQTSEIKPGPPINLTVVSRNTSKVLVSWSAPARPNGIIEGYHLYYTEGNNGETWKNHVDKLGGKIFHLIDSLKAGTHYTIQVKAHNGAGEGSPSNSAHFTTIEERPDPPENLQVESRDFTEIELSWSPPQRPNGRLLSYYIVYNEIGERTELISEKVIDENHEKITYTLPGLKMNTRYSIKVKAKNNRGTGNPSNSLTIATLKPGPVQNLMNISRSSTSFKLRWSLPGKDGTLLDSILVRCQMSQTLTNLPHQEAKRIKLDPNTVEVLLRNLLPATQYVCSVDTNFTTGIVKKARISVWTKPPDLKPPTSPQVIGFTDNSVTLKLFESDDRTVDFYRIVVEWVGKRNGKRRRRRHLGEHPNGNPNAVGRRGQHKNPCPLHVHVQLRVRRVATMRVQDLTHDIHTARENGETAYVTAQFAPHRLRGTFTVGDNKTYNGYYNGPLDKELHYTFWLVAYSNVDGIQQSQLVKADKPVEARSTGAAPTSNSVTVMVGVIAVFILLILIFAILLILWRRHHIAEEREKAEIPSFGPAILPEPETPEASTPVEKEHEVEPLIEVPSTELLVEAEPVYTNTDDVYPPIKVEDLWDYIRSAKQNDLDGLKKEFKLLPAGVTAPCEVARRNENKYKNRYGNIIAYDHTRVLLDPEGDDKTDDYINANYIDGYKKQRVYIAAQGPSKPTLNDIWRMAWKENSKTIIMLTNATESGKKKCEVYWPETGSEQYGNISVQLLETDVLPDFTIRTFLMSKGGQSKYIKQFHYTTWPDHGVPRFGHSLLLFRQKIRTYDPLDSGTVIIHCSAGVGRTGTYISVDTQLEMAKSEGLIDVFNFIHHMRSQRVNMVQTLEQYVFVYDCLLEALICGDTTVASYVFPEVYTELCLFDQDISKTKLEEQFEILKLLSTTIERDESTTALSQDNIFKNRCKNIVPANRCRPYLMTAYDGGNDYINAVYLNSYVKRDQLLVTQMPLPDTVTDFWRLVYDHKSHCIVMLNEVETNDDTCKQYWTEDPGGVTYGPFHVETTSEIKSNPIVTVRDFTLTNIDKEEQEELPRLVRQFHFHRWQEGSATPSSHRALLELVEMLQACTEEQEGPVVVHCMNGASRCGVVCATVTILERLRKEKEIDIFQAVKQLRLNRPQLVDNMEQYQFCHELVLDYLSNDQQEEFGSVS